MALHSPVVDFQPFDVSLSAASCANQGSLVRPACRRGSRIHSVSSSSRPLLEQAWRRFPAGVSLRVDQSAVSVMPAQRFEAATDDDNARSRRDFSGCARKRHEFLIRTLCRVRIARRGDLSQAVGRRHAAQRDYQQGEHGRTSNYSEHQRSPSWKIPGRSGSRWRHRSARNAVIMIDRVRALHERSTASRTSMPDAPLRSRGSRPVMIELRTMIPASAMNPIIEVAGEERVLAGHQADQPRRPGTIPSGSAASAP